MTGFAREISFPERFQILRKIGAGGMGLVYEAIDREREIRVALKTLSQASANTIYLFKQEFRALSGLAHPHLAALYELYEEHGQYFLSMEFIDGVDFLTYLRQNGAAPGSESHGEILGDTTTATRTMVTISGVGQSSGVGAPIVSRGYVPFDEVRLRSAFRQVAEGLTALHRCDRLHRDVKPPNVLVDATGRAVLLDFGLVVELDEPRFGQGPHASSAGTFAYMPPEQFRGGILTPATDWYAAGTMLFEAITGILPFTGDPLEILTAKESVRAPRASSINTATPPDLDELCARLLERNPARRPSGELVLRLLGAATPNIFSRGRAGGDQLFVGRTAEMALLRDAAEKAADMPFLVMISGRSGAGKSSLAERFLEDYSQDSRVLVFHGRCYEQEAVPYKAVDSLMDRIGRYLGELPDDEARALLPVYAGSLVTVFPVLGRAAVFAAATASGPAALDGVELRQRAFGAFRDLLRNLSRDRKLALYIDDLQWSDLDSAALLTEALRSPGGPSLLLLCSYRSEYAENPGLRAFVEKLSSDPSGGNRIARTEIELHPLSAEESAELAESLLPTERFSPEQVEVLVRDSGGLPYFIRELAQAAPAEPGAEITLDGLIWARVQSLQPEARTLLEVVAVAGWPVPQTDAFRAAGLSGRSPLTLNILRSAGLVRSSGPRELDRMETLHDRIRETVVAHLSASDKLLRHRHLADTLEETQHAEPEIIALHLEACDRGARAGKYYATAADKSAAAVAFDRAVDLYGRALRLADLNDPERSAMEVKLAQAHSNAGRSVAAGRTYLSAAGHATGGARLMLEGRAACYLCIGGRHDEGLEMMRAVAMRLGIRLPSTNPGMLFSIIVGDLRFRFRQNHLRTRNAEEVDPALLERIDFLWDVASAIGYSGMFASAEAMIRNLHLSADAGEPYRLGRALVFYQAAKMVAGEKKLSEFMNGLDTARGFFRKAGSPPQGEVFLAMTQAQAMFLAGRFCDALDHARAGATSIISGAHGMNFELSTLRLIILWSLYMLGRYEDVRTESESLAADARLRGDLFTETSVGVASMPLVLLAQDKPEAARRCNEDHIERWQYKGFTLQHVMALESSMMILLYEERPDEALELLEKSRASLRKLLLLGHAMITEFFLTLEARCHLGLAAAGGNNGTKSLHRAAELGERISRCSTVHAEAAANSVRGSVAYLRGQKDEGARRLEISIDRFTALGMEMHANAAKLRLGTWMGQAGQSHLAEAEKYMAREKIVNPEAMARVWMM